MFYLKNFHILLSPNRFRLGDTNPVFLRDQHCRFGTSFLVLIDTPVT